MAKRVRRKGKTNNVHLIFGTRVEIGQGEVPFKLALHRAKTNLSADPHYYLKRLKVLYSKEKGPDKLESGLFIALLEMTRDG